MRYVITDRTVRGGEAVKRSMTQTRAPLSWYVMRRGQLSFEDMKRSCDESFKSFG